jgi:hypothetical protein
MHARVTQFSIPAEKLPEFTAALDSALPLMRQRPGFRHCTTVKIAWHSIRLSRAP